ncbi:MAG: acyl--CoA ligase [Deltaproteobacteria bacterium]|nr:acyl--CoA ligase [Deltaproteobacteria bacterium]
MSWSEALSVVTGPGGMFEVIDAEVSGQKLKVFKNAPPSLRALFDGARGRGDTTFLVYEDERWSFGDVMTRVDALGAALVTHYGIRAGDRVAIAMRNYPEWVVAFAAITSIGAISVSLNAWWTTEENEYALRDSGSRVVVADRERLQRIAPLLGPLGLRAVAVRSEGALPAGAERWDDVVVPGSPLPEAAITPDTDATILYTSGTTGHPKGAVSTHRAVLSALSAFACRNVVNVVMGAGPPKEHSHPPCFILVVPLFHVTGCVPVMLSCFAAGYRLVMMHKWDPARALELIERERVTQFVGVPTQSWDLLECPDFAARDTSSLHSVGGGGAPAPPELVRRVDRSFRTARPNIGYGMTETNAYGPGNTGDDYLRKPTSCGRVVPVVEMRVTGPDDRVLPSNEVGEIWFRGPHLIRGYWNRPDATAETIVDGWLRTGDIGRIDEEGFVFVQDRAKDMVLRAGENVYCAEVEAALYEHPDVYEAAVFGVPHERLGEEVACALVPKPGCTIEPDALRVFLGQHLAPFKIPTQVRIHTERLPRNPAGKILKRQLRDELAGAGG